MWRALKHRIRDRLPYSWLLPLYFWQTRRTCEPLHQKACRIGEFRPLQEIDLSNIKRSSVLFVLGSGASINQISEERWTAIGAHDSVGFNFWLLHRFVPTMYFFESHPASHSEHDQRHNEALVRRSGDYKDTLKVVMDLAHVGHQYTFDLPAEFRRSVHTAGTVSLVARNSEELARGIGALVRRGDFDRSDRIARLPKITGSLSAMIALGARMGYRTIVLCGIDLTSAQYFYQDPVLYPESADFQYMPRAGKHLTLTRYAWGVLPIDEVVLEIKRQVLEPQGIELYVENRSSALWPRIPQAPEWVFEPSAPGGPGPQPPASNARPEPKAV